MKIKKIFATMLATAMVCSSVACGESNDVNSIRDEVKIGDVMGVENTEANASDEKLVVWTHTTDLSKFADKYQKETGVQMEVVTFAPEEYPTKIQTALIGGEKEPDIIVAEPQMLEDFYDMDFFANLDEMGAQEYAGKIVDYVWKVGQDSNGVQRAISYQITPAGFYYRRDIANNVFGTDDPEEIGKLFSSYDEILSTAKILKSGGYRIFASDTEVSYFSGDSAWVKEGVLNLNDARKDYMNLVVSLYKDDLTAYANQWSAPWYQAMNGPVPILTADIQNYADDSINVWDANAFAEQTKDLETTEVFAFGLPSWGVISMKDNIPDTEGKWGVCSGPAYGFGGGTFIGISNNSERKDAAWEFIKYCTLNEETADWWIDESNGDTVSLISALDKHSDDENPVYGNQKMLAFWMKQAEGIDYSKVTRYDTELNNAWGAAISSVKSGEATTEEAIETFYDVVSSTYPELVIVR